MRASPALGLELPIRVGWLRAQSVATVLEAARNEAAPAEAAAEAAARELTSTDAD